MNAAILQFQKLNFFIQHGTMDHQWQQWTQCCLRNLRQKMWDLMGPHKLEYLNHDGRIF